MIVWGGYGPGAVSVETGGMYAPDTDTWTLTPVYAPFGPRDRGGHTLVWTGREVLLFGGYSTFDHLVGRVHRFAPQTNTWLAPASQVMVPRSGMSTVWTGSLLIGWGGTVGSGVLNTGGRYDPALDAWTPTSTLDAPAPRWNHTAVWTGQEMIVWGGSAGSLFNSGGRYDPVSDSWTPTSTVNAPSGRDFYSATWAGTEMIIWGGENLTSPQCCFLATGGRYDPRTDTWRATSMTNAPSGRYSHAAAWTGRTLFVWGGVYFYVDFRGQRQYVYLNDGRRYDPATDTWSTVIPLDAPPPRAGHTAFWTGDRILVWGGSGPTAGQIELRGGRYDPVLDQWQPTSTATPLNVYGGYTGIVWTGTVMIVWGQSNGPTDSGTGARYDPVLDTWVVTSRVSAPPYGGALVWIGDGMLAWQEQMHRYALSPDGDHDGVTVCGGDCNDGNPAVRPGATEVCNGIDDECDGLVDETFDQDGDGHTTCGGDCNDADPFVWSAPVEVADLIVVADPSTQITWSGQDFQAGPETMYDFVSGTTSLSATFDASTAVCLWSGAQPAAVDGRADPSRGHTYWYLVRARNVCGIGTYGGPALDNAIPPCP